MKCSKLWSPKCKAIELDWTSLDSVPARKFWDYEHTEQVASLKIKHFISLEKRNGLMPASTQRMRKPKKIRQYIIHTCFSSQLFLPSFAYSKFDIIKIRLIFLPVIFHLALPITGRKQPPQTNKDLIRTIEKLQELKKPVYRHCLEVFTHL